MENVTARSEHAKEPFQKTYKVLRNGKHSFQIKKIVLDWSLMCILLYGTECWTFPPTPTPDPRLRGKIGTTEFCIYKRILISPWTEQESNKNFLWKKTTEITLILAFMKKTKTTGIP